MHVTCEKYTEIQSGQDAHLGHSHREIEVEHHMPPARRDIHRLPRLLQDLNRGTGEIRAHTHSIQ